LRIRRSGFIDQNFAHGGSQTEIRLDAGAKEFARGMGDA